MFLLRFHYITEKNKWLYKLIYVKEKLQKEKEKSPIWGLIN